MKHSDYVEIAKSYGISAIKNVLIRWAVSQLPIFASGPLNFLLVKLASKIAKDIAEESEMRVFFKYIDMKVDSQAKNFEIAMEENHLAQQSGDQIRMKNAEEKIKIALHNLVSLNK